jgi:hypothetical protein
MTRSFRQSLTVGFACCATLVACEAHDTGRPPAAPAAASVPALGLEPARTGASASWSKYPLLAACAAPPGEPGVLKLGLTLVSSEQEYRRQFCRSSSIDWDEYRYVVYQESLAPQRVWLEDVVRDGEDILLVLRHAAANCEVFTYEYQSEIVSLLIPQGPGRVRLHFTPGPPC